MNEWTQYFWCFCVTLDSRWMQTLTGGPEEQVQRCVWHHPHYGEDGGPEESVQRPGGRTAQTDGLRLRPHRPVWHHEAVLQQRVGEYVTVLSDLNLTKYQIITRAASNSYFEHELICWLFSQVIKYILCLSVLYFIQCQTWTAVIELLNFYFETWYMCSKHKELHYLNWF